MGLLLRFWHLDSKPLWLDEVITALFTLGRSYQEIPLDTLFPATVLDQVFAYRPGVSCAAIAHRVTTESVHPPLFFCLLYQWIGWMPDGNWVWAMRSLPALLGVGAIAALFHLNRIAFSTPAGLMGAALMAVSPFAVYLSQEARHYTLPMLLVTLALAALVQMQQDLQHQKIRPQVWIGWVLLNLLGLYVHYLVALAIAAQVGALAAWMIWQRRNLCWRDWGRALLATGAIALGYLPWLPMFLAHLTRPETDWLKPYDPDWLDRLAPIYQALSGWVLMVVALPVEEQPWAIALPAIVVMVGFVLWLTRQVWQGLRRCWQHPNLRSPLFLLGGFVLFSLVEFFTIVYGLGKDITVVPRYNFVYYPAVCALLGASLTPFSATGASQPLPLQWLSRRGAIALLAGLCSSLMVVNGLVFQKPYYPDQVAQTLYRGSEDPLVLVVSYRSLQEVALGLSFALELRKLYPTQPALPLRLGFLSAAEGNPPVWRILPHLEQDLPLPLDLWIVATPGVRIRNFPDQLRVNDPATSNPRPKGTCDRNPEETHRLGFPYQLYHCNPSGQ